MDIPASGRTIATKVVLAIAVLGLAGGAASAAGRGAQPTTPIGAEMTRLQTVWGPYVVHSVSHIAGSHALLVGTLDPALLRSATPQRRLGASYPVVVTFAGAAGRVYPSLDNRCASGTGTPRMKDPREIG